ncbi:MAG: S8 family serine peptidase [Pseudomonadota bacterium]|nr:S8 family serine peptidase [Pseudomonadota bacterium]
MNTKRAVLVGICGSLLAVAQCLSGLGALAQDKPATWEESTQRLIVKWRADVTNHSAANHQPAAHPAALLARTSAAAGLPLSYKRAMSGGAHVLNLPHEMAMNDAKRIIARLRADPLIEYAEPDRRRYAMRVPNDSLFTNQWNLMEPVGVNTGAINLPGAWDITTGAAGIVVAVIDTGILAHADIDTARLLPGYDFIVLDPTSPPMPLTANDGDGRDADPGDPGDWITQAESNSGFFKGCDVADSSWHGTHNAGIIGAATENGMGVAGINWAARILPLRALGKCGGYTSDIIDAMRWAAGLASPALPPVNPNPAQIINASLGGAGPCSAAEQSAVNDVLAAGARAVVVPSGNEGADANQSSPASCANVITVGAVTRSGARAPYSNFGSVVTVSAPGGSVTTTSPGANGILSTLNEGLTSPTTDAYAFLQGTSFATSHVSGVISLLLSINPDLTAAQVRGIIQSTARAFPDGSCTTARCGAGIIDANAAVRLAQQGLTASPLNLTFAATLVNQQSIQTTSFTNSGVTELMLGSAAIEGGQPPDFRLTSDTCSNQTLALQARCQIAVAFMPMAAGARNASLVVLSNAVTSPSRVALSGTGVMPAAEDGGGGGGGCAITQQARFDPALLLLLLAASAGLCRAAQQRRDRRSSEMT